MSSFNIAVTAVGTQANMKQHYLRGTAEPKEQIIALREYFARLAGGIEQATVRIATASANPVAASMTVTVDFDTMTANDVLSIGGNSFTAKASPSGESEFLFATDDATTAENLLVKINAHSTVGQVVAATRAAAVITLTCLIPGVIGNFIVVTKTVTNAAALTLSAAKLGSGAGGITEAARTYALGL